LFTHNIFLTLQENNNLDMEWQRDIHSDPKIRLGKPVIKGTRLSVDFLLGLFASGWTEKQVLDNYPGLSKGNIQAIFAYAKECLEDGLLYELPKEHD